MPIQSQNSMTKAIQIYNDEGISSSTKDALVRSLASYPLSLIDAGQICTTSWEEKTCLLIIPGGRDLPYHKKLKGKGNERIKRFVENGGAYLGICGGGYYGASYIEFDKGYPLEVIGERELAFFPFTAIGPAYGNNTYRYNSESGARASPIRFGSHSAHIYYNGGCYFSLPSPHPDIRVLATYQDLSLPAIIECKVGKGKAILSGVHFEMGHSDLPASDHFLEKVLPLLNDSELTRKTILNKIINSLINKHIS